MNDTEYREMYTEYCAEQGARPTDRGFMEFKAWRKKVEDTFEEHNYKAHMQSEASGRVAEAVFFKKYKKT